jgi:hypothetical protein
MVATVAVTGVCPSASTHVWRDNLPRVENFGVSEAKVLCRLAPRSHARTKCHSEKTARVVKRTGASQTRMQQSVLPPYINTVHHLGAGSALELGGEMNPQVVWILPLDVGFPFCDHVTAPCCFV